jgi:aminopeptidase N
VEGYREIVGDDVFFTFTKAIQREFAHGNLSTAEFIDRAVDASGLAGGQRTLLEQFFQQWLYGEAKPSILPDAFV